MDKASNRKIAIAFMVGWAVFLAFLIATAIL